MFLNTSVNRLRIAQEIQREQEEIEVELRDLEVRGVMIEKELRGEDQLPDLWVVFQAFQTTRNLIPCININE